MLNIPEASIIVPVYNAEKYLKTCLESIQKQSFKNFEVIIIDDGSTDRSSVICKQFEKKDARFHVWRQANGGVGKARKVGLEKARGKYIFWIDADDWAESTLLEIAMRGFKETDCDVFMWGCNNSQKTQSLDLRKKSLKEWQEAILLGKNAVLWLFAAKKSVWDKISFPEKLRVAGEDGLCSLELFLHIKTIEFCKSPLYHHREEIVSSMSHKISSYRYFDTMILWKKRLEIAIQSFPEQIETCLIGVLSCAVKAYCMSVNLQDLQDKEIKEIILTLRGIKNDKIPRRYKEKFLKWAILHNYNYICRYYGTHKCK